MGVGVGGRLGHEIFYNTSVFLNNPLDFFNFRQGGMSFHGGLIGVIVGILYYCHKHKQPLLKIWDLAAIYAPIGLGFGRIGNFINQELYGKITNSWVGINFSLVDDNYRHPTQIYEFLLEGVILFILLKLISKKISTPGITSFSFIILYGIFRYISEIFREPLDGVFQIMSATLSYGQILSIIMIITGSIFLTIISTRNINR